MSIEKEFHRLIIDNEAVLPSRFTYPFNYVPHSLSLEAARQAREFIKSTLCSDSEIASFIGKGKMFGVLVVKYGEDYGYLIAFSGNINHSNRYEGFVPPVFDLLDREGFFVEGECELNELNRQINELGESNDIKQLKLELSDAEIELINLKTENKRLLQEGKRCRDEQRKLNADDNEFLNRLIAESQYQKAECRRKELALKNRVEELRERVVLFEDKVQLLRRRRKELSLSLQRKIFENFVLLNARGEKSNLLEIFANYSLPLPPAGAGECAAPKLLQFAYKNGMTPICMAEFWWGESPKDEVRVDGHFYPACKSKCEPILNFMLQGLDVEPNPIEARGLNSSPRLLFEDDWILAVDKPSGMLSMRGKVNVPSVDEWLKVVYEGCNYFVAHRLDMDTSGVLLIAKDFDTYKALQGLFARKLVQKRYRAIVGRELECGEGRINLPLIADIDNRPFQRVDYQYGKESLTLYRVLEKREGMSLVEFTPLTGRTHQLRVHSAHKDGLNAPIVGDNLYGTPGERLMLHAESVFFRHPVTKQIVEIIAPSPIKF